MFFHDFFLIKAKPMTSFITNFEDMLNIIKKCSRIQFPNFSWDLHLILQVYKNYIWKKDLPDIGELCFFRIQLPYNSNTWCILKVLSEQNPYPQIWRTKAPATLELK